MTAVAALRHEASEEHQRRLQEDRAWKWNDDTVEPNWGAPIGPPPEQSAWEYHSHGERTADFIAFWLEGILAEQRGERAETMEAFLFRYDDACRKDDWGGWGGGGAGEWGGWEDQGADGQWREGGDAATSWGDGNAAGNVGEWGPPEPAWPTDQWNAEGGWGSAAEEVTPWDHAAAEDRPEAPVLAQKPSDSDRTSPGRGAGRRKHRRRIKGALEDRLPHAPGVQQWKGTNGERRLKKEEFLEVSADGFPSCSLPWLMLTLIDAYR